MVIEPGLNKRTIEKIIVECHVKLTKNHGHANGAFFWQKREGGHWKTRLVGYAGDLAGKLEPEKDQLVWVRNFPRPLPEIRSAFREGDIFTFSIGDWRYSFCLPDGSYAGAAKIAKATA